MTEEIQLSDAEKRMLRRVFHRHARPYIAALALVALIALAGGSDEGEESDDGETVPVATVPHVDVDALQQTQKRAEELLTEVVAAREKRVAELGEANQQIAALEKRLGTTARKLEKVESVARAALKAAGKLPPDAADWDVSAMLERLDELEAGQAVNTASIAKRHLAGAAGNVPAAPSNGWPRQD